MFKMYASDFHSYTRLILALGIIRKPTVWVFITIHYPGIHDIGLPILAYMFRLVLLTSVKILLCSRLFGTKKRDGELLNATASYRDVAQLSKY